MPNNVIPVGGGPNFLNDLNDVDLAVSPVDGDTICFESATGLWKNVPKSSGSSKDPEYFLGESTATTAVAFNTPTTVFYTTVLSDVNGNYASATGEYTAPHTGLYTISATASMTRTASTGNGRTTIFIDVNGKDYFNSSAAFHDGGFGLVTPSTTGTILLNAGDVVKIELNQTHSGSPLAMANNGTQHFSVVCVAEA